MKAKLEYHLPEDETEFNWARNGYEYWDSISELKEQYISEVSVNDLYERYIANSSIDMDV
jgi:hypothetical protein